MCWLRVIALVELLAICSAIAPRCAFLAAPPLRAGDRGAGLRGGQAAAAGRPPARPHQSVTDARACDAGPTGWQPLWWKRGESWRRRRGEGAGAQLLCGLQACPPPAPTHAAPLVPGASLARCSCPPGAAGPPAWARRRGPGAAAASPGLAAAMPRLPPPRPSSAPPPCRRRRAGVAPSPASPPPTLRRAAPRAVQLLVHRARFDSVGSRPTTSAGWGRLRRDAGDRYVKADRGTCTRSSSTRPTTCPT